MFRIVSLLFLFAVCGVSAASAQSLFTTESTTQQQNSITEGSIDHSVYMDVETKTCFVDLEQLPMNLQQAALINKDGDEVIVKQLDDVPVDSIIELDYSDLPSGDYLLELRSYTGKSHKALSL